MSEPWQGFDTEPDARTQGLSLFEALLVRRRELTLRARIAQQQIETLKTQLAQAEIEAETAWESAVDIHEALRRARLHLHEIGVDDNAINALINRYSTPLQAEKQTTTKPSGTVQT